MLYKVKFYKNKNGKYPIKDYLKSLAGTAAKSDRIKLQKIRDYIKYLRIYGFEAKEPYVKHLDGEIWELRPLRDRFLFAAWDGQSFILLHHFVKKTKKTPQREIEQAKRNFADYKQRSKDDEK